MLSLKWNLLGYATCRIWQVQAFTLIQLFGYDNHDTAFFWLWSSIALLVGVPLLKKGVNDRAVRSRLIVCSALVAYMGVFSFLVAIFLEQALLFYIGIACSGLGLALMWLLWANRFAALSTSEVLKYTAIDFGLMIFVDLFANLFFSSASGSIALFALVPAASIILLAKDFRSDGTWIDELTRKQTTHAFPWRTLVGICTVIFAFQFAYFFSVTALYPGVELFERDSGDLLGLLMFVVLVVLFGKRVNLMTVYRIVIPLILVAFVLCYLLPLNSSSFSAVLAGGGVKCALLFFWVLVINLAQKSDKPWTVLGLGLAARFLGNSLAIYIGSALPSDLFGLSVDWLALLCVCVISCFMVLVMPKEEVLVPVEQAKTVDANSSSRTMQDLFASRCEGIAEKHHLTKREAEVLELLMQGRSQTVIAEKLHIGTGTAHSHILHIYQKLEVHSKQELFDYLHDA